MPRTVRSLPPMLLIVVGFLISGHFSWRPEPRSLAIGVSLIFLGTVWGLSAKPWPARLVAGTLAAGFVGALTLALGAITRAILPTM
jgi:hypothetical protein